MTGLLDSHKRRLLCEGWIEPGCAGTADGCVFFPERGYVVQAAQTNESAGRIWFAHGRPAAGLVESVLEGLANTLGRFTLVEAYEQLHLEERKLPDGTSTKMPKDGRWFVEGPFQRSGVRNANKRVYPLGIWEKLIADDKSYVQQTVRARGMLGHLEHPSDGRTDGTKGAIVITDLKLKEDGVVWGVAEILDGTPSGQILQEYTRKNVRWGVSSRGNGTVKDDGTVDEASYVLETWDAVMKPSVPGAYPTLSNSTAPGAKPVEGTTVAQPNTSTTKAAVLETEAATQFAAEVKTLSETDVADLDASARTKLTSDLLRTMDRGSTLVSKNELDAGRAVELQGWLTRKLLGLTESIGTVSCETAIDEALRDVEGDGNEQDAGYHRVIESLTQRLTDSVEESGELRERLEAAESRSSALQGQCDELTEQLSAVEGRLADTKVRLKLAEDLLATRPAAKANGLVTAAVEEAIGQVPALRGFGDLLETAQTPEGVMDLAERLLPSALPGRRKSQGAVPTNAVAAVPRSSLPTGVVVESDDEGVLATAKPRSSALSEGAQLASAALAVLGR